MSVHFVLDSSMDLPKEFLSRVSVVPMPLTFGDEEYLDGVTISNREFYEKLQASSANPATSQPTPDAFAQAFKAAVDAGHEVVAITLSSQLSGTYQSATIASMDFPGKVHVVDSLSATIGIGLLAQLGFAMADEGKSAAEIAECLIREREKVQIVAMVDTLEYLKRGGRVSKTVAFAGELLSIKPLVGVVEGKVVVLGKARGTKQANKQINKLIEGYGGIDFSKPAMMAYSGLDDDLLQKYIADSEDVWQNRRYPIASICSTIGTHVGPGAFAAAFFKK